MTRYKTPSVQNAVSFRERKSFDKIIAIKYDEVHRIHKKAKLLMYQLFKMEISGEIEQTYSKGWRWKLGNKNSEGEWISPTFSDNEYFNYLSFWIKPKEKEPEYGKLYLLQFSNDGYKDTRDYKLHIKLTYCRKIKEFSVNTEYVKFKEYKYACGHYLEEIKINTLQEIRCIFLKMKMYFQIDREIGEAGIDECFRKDVWPKYSAEVLNQTEQAIQKNVENTWADWEQFDNKEEKNVTNSKNEDEKIEDEITCRGLNSLSENLKNAYLCEKDSDVILDVKGRKYPAHKVILRVRSPVFRAMLEHDMKEKIEGVIDISDCDPYIFQDFLFYLYAGKLNTISAENVFELYQMSDKYDVKELKAACSNFMLKNLTVDFVCDALSLAIRHCQLDLLAGATEFFTANAKDILETVNWKMFMKEYPVQANELFLTTLSTFSVNWPQ